MPYIANEGISVLFDFFVYILYNKKRIKLSPEAHSKGIGYGAWQAVEEMHPETEVWENCTPYFEKRNIHFYVNKCGFQIDQFWCASFQPEHNLSDDEEHIGDEGPDEMFRFIKIMKK